MTSIFKQAATQSLSSMYRVPSVEGVEARIRAEVWKKQIRMKTFFEDYDKLRKGHCIEDKFISGLASALSFLNLHLSAEETKALADKYRLEPGDLVKYSEFVAAIDEQFGNTELARSNLAQLRENGGVGEEAGRAEQVLDYIRWAVASRRIFIKPPLQDYDRTNSNLVTREQFVRVLDNLGLVRNEELADLLARRYARSTNPKEVCYQDFIREIEDVNRIEALAVRGVVPNPQLPDPLKNVATDLHRDSLTEEFYVQKRLPDRAKPVEEVLRRIQAEVTLKRIRIREFFLDFDGLRKNIVTGLQFRRVLNGQGLALSDKEFRELLRVYGADAEGGREERVRWMDFCEDVDKVFTVKELEKDPLVRVGQIEKAVFEPVRHPALSFTAEEEAALGGLLGGYREVIATKRLHLKPQFEDFDVTKIGYVTKNQFVRILKQFELFPPTDRLFNLLLKKYMDRGNLADVNYYEFIRDVDRYNEVGQQLSKAHTDNFQHFAYRPRQTNATIRSHAPDDLADLLARLRRTVKEKRIRVAEFMRDFDKLRHGSITRQQLRLALNMAQLPLSDVEFTAISDGFATAGKANYVNWKEFTDAIDEVFGTKELEKVSPHLAVEQPKTSISYGRVGISAEQLAVANRIKDSFREYQLVNRLDTKQLFENWDKLSRFKVSAKQFRQVLATVGFSLSEEENRAICKLYASDDEDESEVLYLEFLRDTKPYDYSYMTVVKDQPKRGTGERRPIPENIEDILFELRRATKLNRLRYREYFQDFDPLRKGAVKKNKFRSVVLQTMKVTIDERLFAKIEEYYRDPADDTLVGYAKFCDDLEIVFNLPDREKEPTLRPRDFDYTVTYSKKEEESIDALMRRLGEVTRKHRILLKPFFQDKDVAKIGRVSFTRMRSILDNNKIPLTDAQFTLLCTNFAYDRIEFNYLDFIESLKQYEGYDE